MQNGGRSIRAGGDADAAHTRDLPASHGGLHAPGDHKISAWSARGAAHSPGMSVLTRPARAHEESPMFGNGYADRMDRADRADRIDIGSFVTPRRDYSELSHTG